jgi:hypothetical protein
VSINAWWHAAALLLCLTQFVWIFWVMDLLGRWWGYGFASTTFLLLGIRPTSYRNGRLTWIPTLKPHAGSLIAIWVLFWVWLILGHNFRPINAWAVWLFFVSLGIVWLALWRLRRRRNA